MSRQIEDELFFALQRYHLLFKVFWELADYSFDEVVPTACITFDRNSGSPIKLHINPKFWDERNFSEKLFVIMHEMLHVLLEHGKRFKELKQLEYPDEIKNIAMDVAINEMIIWLYDFDKTELSEEFLTNSCWVDSIHAKQGWKDKEFAPPKTKSTEFYLGELDFKVVPVFSMAGGHNLEDFDESMTSILDSGDRSGVLNDFYDKIEERLHELAEDKVEESESKKAQEVQCKQRGMEKGCLYKVLKKAKKKINRKWENVVKKWAALQLEERDIPLDRWDRKDRRYENILKRNGHIKMPSILDTPKLIPVKNRILVFFYLDTSGSCISYAERFFNAASTLDPKRFDVRLFCFDTEVYETSLKTRKVYGGGGTSFDIIEDSVQSYTKEHKMKYPKAVWILSDGYGNAVTPAQPKNWYWFLTEGHTDNLIHPKSHKFLLSNYE